MNTQYDDIFRYHFDSLYSMTKECMLFNYSDDHEDVTNTDVKLLQESEHLFEFFSISFERQMDMFMEYRHWIETCVYKIVRNMLERAGIPFKEIYQETRNEKASILYEHEGQTIQAYFLYDISYGLEFRTSYDKLVDSLREAACEADVVKVFVFRDRITFTDLGILVNNSEKNADNFVEVRTLKEFFLDFFSEEIYKSFEDYVRQYCEAGNSILAYSTVLAPTESTLTLFKRRKKQMLMELDYKAIMHSGKVGILNEDDFNRIRENCLNNGMFSAMVSDCDFAQSFISAEWFYDVYSDVMGELERTCIIAGYLKSVEQLLGKIVGFHKDQGYRIKTRRNGHQLYTSNNEEEIDSTLGALKDFIRKAKLSLTVNIRGCFTTTLEGWISDQRNGFFHKDNIFLPAKIDEVRKMTLFLYFIILGGLRYNESELVKLGVHSLDKTDKPGIDSQDVANRFYNWLKNALKYDTSNEESYYHLAIYDHDNEVKIYVHDIRPFSLEEYESGLITKKSINENFTFNHTKKWPSISWKNQVCVGKNALMQVSDYISLFAEKNPDLMNKVGGIIGTYEGTVILPYIKKKG